MSSTHAFRADTEKDERLIRIQSQAIETASTKSNLSQSLMKAEVKKCENPIANNISKFQK